MERHGYEAYLVGGCVRDFLMGLKPKDYDICTSALPEDICDIFNNTIPTGMKHGTITVLLDNKPIEVTTFRIDTVYTDHRRPDSVRFTSSLNDDLKRRDFTINAIAYHPQKGVIDPFGGARDIQDRIIRTVGEPIKRFEEDALRMLRAIRFKARFGFTIAANTKKAITALAGSIRYVSRERILSEMNNILTGGFPEAINVMYETGLIGHIFPSASKGIKETFVEPEINNSNAINYQTNTVAGAPTYAPAMGDFSAIRNLPLKLSIRWAALFRLMGFSDLKEVTKLCNGLKMSNALKKEIFHVIDIFSKPLP
ncbi:MAG: hypothetical protein GX757_08625, partial [Clostridiales bacterium]|nr:hypothetical protein [Clostridiales bacterium]